MRSVNNKEELIKALMIKEVAMAQYKGNSFSIVATYLKSRLSFNKPEFLPRVEDCAKDLNYSYDTVRRAYSELIECGFMIETHHYSDMRFLNQYILNKNMIKVRGKYTYEYFHNLLTIEILNMNYTVSSVQMVLYYLNDHIENMKDWFEIPNTPVISQEIGLHNMTICNAINKMLNDKVLLDIKGTHYTRISFRKYKFMY